MLWLLVALVLVAGVLTEPANEVQGFALYALLSDDVAQGRRHAGGRPRVRVPGSRRDTEARYPATSPAGAGDTDARTTPGMTTPLRDVVAQESVKREAPQFICGLGPHPSNQNQCTQQPVHPGTRTES